MKPAMTETGRFLQRIGEEIDEDNRATDAKAMYAAADLVDMQTLALLAVTEFPGFKYQIGMWAERGPLIEKALAAAGLDTEAKREAAWKQFRPQMPIAVEACDDDVNVDL